MRLEDDPLLLGPDKFSRLNSLLNFPEVMTLLYDKRYPGMACFFFGCQVENFTKSANKPEITPEMLHTQKKNTKNSVDVETNNFGTAVVFLLLGR